GVVDIASGRIKATTRCAKLIRSGRAIWWCRVLHHFQQIGGARIGSSNLRMYAPWSCHDAGNQFIEAFVEFSGCLHQGRIVADDHQGGWPNISDCGSQTTFRLRDENFNRSEQAGGEVMPDHGDGEEGIAEDPSHHSPTDPEFRQPTAMVNLVEKHKSAPPHEPFFNCAAVLDLADRLLC